MRRAPKVTANNDIGTENCFLFTNTSFERETIRATRRGIDSGVAVAVVVVRKGIGEGSVAWTQNESDVHLAHCNHNELNKVGSVG